MDVRPHIIIMVVSVIVVVSVSAADLERETLLSGLENSEVSLFATTSDEVSHMETDNYKPGYVMYTDKHALKTSDGNITQTIAGHSTTSGYKEGVGEDARFNLVSGFTQISPTRVIVLDHDNHCLRQVDRVSRVTSVFAGQCQSQGYQDGASAKFHWPKAVIVDMRSSNQLLVTDEGNNAVRTVEIESKNVGTFIKPDQLIFMYDLVQDKITGDIYITNYNSLYKLSYNTRALNIISYGSTGQINGKQPSSLWGLFKIETVILVADTSNDRILKYDTAYDTWSTLNACDVTKTHKNTNECVTKSPWSILLTSNRLLIGGDKKITSYLPPQTLTCPKKQVALTSPENGLATFQLKFGDQTQMLMLPLGHHTYIIKSSDQICNVTLDAKDYRVRRTLELVADYSVDCSVVNSTVTWSLLKDVAQQKYTVIEALCGSACKTPGGNARPVISCDGVDDLQIRWPTDLAFTADVVSVPANIRQPLEKRIRATGPTLNVVLFGATPPIVYPRKAGNGGYVSVSLSTTCIDGLSYSEIEKKCV